MASVEHGQAIFCAGPGSVSLYAAHRIVRNTEAQTNNPLKHPHTPFVPTNKFHKYFEILSLSLLRIIELWS